MRFNNLNYYYHKEQLFDDDEDEDNKEDEDYIYYCEYCYKEFDDEDECEYHEKYCKKNKNN